MRAAATTLPPPALAVPLLRESMLRMDVLHGALSCEAGIAATAATAATAAVVGASQELAASSGSGSSASKRRRQRRAGKAARSCIAKLVKSGVGVGSGEAATPRQQFLHHPGTSRFDCLCTIASAHVLLGQLGGLGGGVGVPGGWVDTGMGVCTTDDRRRLCGLHGMSVAVAAVVAAGSPLHTHTSSAAWLTQEMAGDVLDAAAQLLTSPARSQEFVPVCRLQLCAAVWWHPM